MEHEDVSGDWARRSTWKSSSRAPAFVRSSTSSTSCLEMTQKEGIQDHRRGPELSPLSYSSGKDERASGWNHPKETFQESNNERPDGNSGAQDKNKYQRRNNSPPRQDRPRSRSPQEKHSDERRFERSRGDRNERNSQAWRGDWRHDRRQRDDRNDRANRRGYDDRGGRNRQEQYERNYEARQEELEKLPAYINPRAVNVPKIIEQQEKRKLLWSKSKKDEPAPAKASSALWQSVEFAGDKDGSVANKFKKLMGVKEDAASTSTCAAPDETRKPDILVHQEEIFRNLDRQYHAARLSTHTQRGVGLGFNS